MLLVIYGHLLEPIYPARPDLGRDFASLAFAQWQVIYSFHMMLFFFVSGVVNRSLPKKPWHEALRASLRLLALAWVVHLLGVFVAFVSGTRPDLFASAQTALSGTLLPLVQGYYWSVGVLWFLTSLCCVQFLAYLCLHFRIPPPLIIVAALIGTVAVVYLDAPNQFLFRTWMPALSFFVLGFVWSQHLPRLPGWTLVPLCIAVVLLAPLNGGCSFSAGETCEPTFGVRMFAGAYGYLPLFFLSAVVGTLAVASASMLLAKTALAEFLATIGRNSLELFIINGFVATFLPPVIAGVRWPASSWWFYPIAAVIVIALHLVALQLLRVPLRLINDAASRISTFLAGLAATAAQAVAGARSSE